MAQRGGVLDQFCSQLSSVHVGEPIALDGVSLFPLCWPEAEPSPVDLYEEALERGDVELTEKGSGDVPEIQLHNHGTRPILIPEGALLIGARQNRVTNATVVVAARSVFTVPVSCVERGRWSWRSKQFAHGWYAPPSLRAMKSRQVHESLHSEGRPHSDQMRVWGGVASFLAARRAMHPDDDLASAYHAYEEEPAVDAGELLERLPPNTAGLAVAVEDRIVGMDLFDEAKKFRRTFKGLLAGYLTELLWRTGQERREQADEHEPPPAPAKDLAERFFQRVKAAARVRPQRIGISEEIEIDSREVVGMAVVYEGRICHLAAFAG